MESTKSGGSTRKDLWTGGAGVGFVVLFAVGFLLMYQTPANDAPPAEWADYFTDDDNQTKSVAGGLMASLGVAGFIWFAAGLWNRVRRPVAATAESAAAISAAVFAALALAGIAATATVAGGALLGDNAVPQDGDLVIQLEGLGFSLTVAMGGFALAVFIATISWLGSSQKAFPQWLAWAGYVGAVAAVLSFTFVGFLVAMLWILVAAITVAVTPRPA